MRRQRVPRLGRAAIMIAQAGTPRDAPATLPPFPTAAGTERRRAAQCCGTGSACRRHRVAIARGSSRAAGAPRASRPHSRPAELPLGEGAET
jgi:hypothetical protein